MRRERTAKSHRLGATVNATVKRRQFLVSTLAVGLLASGAMTGCATSRAQGAAGGRLSVVAAESFWGSLASQLGGDKVDVVSLIDNPATDPHDYEPTAADARAVATASLVIVNGVGYDAWASKLVAANPTSGRQVITVGKLVGAPSDANPHRWYNPTDVKQVVAAITASLTKADPADAGYFASTRQTFQTTGLADYNALIADIKAKYAGTPVGASESIFAMLAPALGLDLVTPPRFLRAISEGSEPTASDKTTIDRQIQQHRITVYVYNSQNATPDVQAQVDEAKAAGIPVTTITETLQPTGATFQSWQVAQLKALENALAKAKTATAASAAPAAAAAVVTSERAA
ncbi:MAG: metal ABC transporter solute-binding protein, Zn/Mn family [Acidothermaceae bacterium]